MIHALRKLFILAMILSSLKAIEDFDSLKSFVELNEIDPGLESFDTFLVNCFNAHIEMAKEKIEDEGTIAKKLKDGDPTLTHLVKIAAKFFEKLVIFKDNHEKVAEFIIKMYHPATYHNACHGLMVAFYSLKIYEDLKKKT